MSDSFPLASSGNSSTDFTSLDHPGYFVRPSMDGQSLVSELIKFGSEGLDHAIRNVIDQLPIVVWTTDLNLRLTSHYGALDKVLDTNSTPNLGSRIDEYFRNSNEAPFPLDLLRKALTGLPAKYEMNRLSRLIRTYVEPLKNAEDQIIGTAGVSIDLTDPARGEMKLKKQVDGLILLRTITDACTEAGNEDDLFAKVTEVLSNVLSPESMGFFLVEEASNELVMHHSYHHNGKISIPNRIPIGIGAAGKAAMFGNPVRVSRSPAGRLSEGAVANLKSELCVPILLGGSVLGVIHAGSMAVNGFDDCDEELLINTANQVSSGIQRIRHDADDLRRQSELETLHQVNLRLTSHQEIRSSLGSLLENALKLVHSDETAILLLETNELTFTADACSSDYAKDPLPVDKLKDAAKEVLRRGKVLTYPGSNGNTLHASISSTSSIAGIPLMFEDQIKGVMLVAYLRPHVFQENELGILELFADQTVFALKNAELSEELESAYLQTVLSLAKTVDARDSDTSDHSQKISIWADAITRAMGKDDIENRSIFWAALLHDIGKIGVPDAILRKPGPLTEEEWVIMRKHPKLGAEIVIPVKRFEDVAPIILAHHEKFDGTGYPYGLKGTEIPIGARILAVVDAYTTITSDRVYRKARSKDEAVKEIITGTGTQFDPQVVKVFLKLISELEPGNPA